MRKKLAPVISAVITMIVCIVLGVSFLQIVRHKTPNRNHYTVIERGGEKIVNGKVVETLPTERTVIDTNSSTRPTRPAKLTHNGTPSLWGDHVLFRVWETQQWSCVTPWGPCATTVKYTQDAVASWYGGWTTLNYSEIYIDGCPSLFCYFPNNPGDHGKHDGTHGHYVLTQGVPCWGGDGYCGNNIWYGDEWTVVVNRPFQSTIMPDLWGTLVILGDGEWWDDAGCANCG